MLTRRNLLRGLLGGTLAGFSVAGYGFGIEPALRLRVQEWHITRDDWTAPPLRIAAIADLHVGEPHVGLGRVRQVVRRANDLDADLIVLLGDYAAGHRFVTRPVSMDDVAPVLGELRAPLGVFAILGNHDWWDDPVAQRGDGPNLYATALEHAGIPVLSNRAIRLPDFWLAGVEDQLAIRAPGGGWRGLDDLDGTLAQITDDAPVVLLAHEPDIFARVPDRVALQLSGHTHGGQVRLFGHSPVVPSRYGNRYAYGHIRENGRDLVVSGGIGMSIMPLRFGVPPEITLVQISGPRGLSLANPPATV
ncbi:metallophosphoesterase [Paracoccus sp. (in: a-proteobacteria)]|uniref:metallophosphoesterase n=1 Tax=Paracoccus sp. TaxID=267 RepID=UPI0026DEE36E|nr:metallophosphoesterase [Paracoccus sp. (in: a-proteobacteria)]MDO5647178.1 metallophosphoesterase [Paracoccus sp. (in: a-proteobacteria)]